MPLTLLSLFQISQSTIALFPTRITTSDRHGDTVLARPGPSPAAPEGERIETVQLMLMESFRLDFILPGNLPRTAHSTQQKAHQGLFSLICHVSHGNLRHKTLKERVSVILIVARNI